MVLTSKAFYNYCLVYYGVCEANNCNEKSSFTNYLIRISLGFHLHLLIIGCPSGHSSCGVPGGTSASNVPLGPD